MCQYDYLISFKCAIRWLDDYHFLASQLLKDGAVLNDSIGVKKLGFPDFNTILSSVKKKYPDADAMEKANEFVRQFSKKIKNPDWFPFMLRMVDADHKVHITLMR